MFDNILSRNNRIKEAALKLQNLMPNVDPQELYNFMLEFNEDGDFTGKYIKKMGKAYYSVMTSLRDELFDEAAKVIVIAQQGSASLFQRKLKLGYNRAGRIIDQMEAAGIVGPFEGSKARQVIIHDLSTLEQY